MFARYMQFSLFLLAKGVLRHKHHKFPPNYAFKQPLQGDPGGVRYLYSG